MRSEEKMFEATIPVGSLKFRFTASDSNANRENLDEIVGSIICNLENAIESYFYNSDETEEGLGIESEELFFTQLETARWGVEPRRYYPPRGNPGDLVKVCVPDDWEGQLYANNSVSSNEFWHPDKGVSLRDFVRQTLNVSEAELVVIAGRWDSRVLSTKTSAHYPVFDEMVSGVKLPGSGMEMIKCSISHGVPDWSSDSVSGRLGIVTGEDEFLPQSGGSQRMCHIRFAEGADPESHKNWCYRWKTVEPMVPNTGIQGYLRECVPLIGVTLKPSHFRVVSKA